MFDKQDLARQGQVHQARGDRLDQAFDLGRLGSLGHVLGIVVPHHHITDMDTDPRRQARRFRRVELAQPALVVQREGNRLHRALEHHHEAVGLVDLAASVAVCQGARQAIVLADQFRRQQIPEAFDQCRGINQVTKQQCPQHRAGMGFCRCVRAGCRSGGHGKFHSLRSGPAFCAARCAISSNVHLRAGAGIAPGATGRPDSGLAGC
jgi:hypothetical protein